ncbi:type I restriction endonuclease subunit M [Propionivibrio sp.]|uniref:type I restriction endonuclease subunit M n=1 Tax=Propionivibrio sp. TaxID=2212460 RepID=UPI003BF12266
MSNKLLDLPATSLSMPTPHDDGPLFPLGRTVATPGALAHCDKHNVSPLSLIAQHHRGQWGCLVKDDKIANESALFSGGRLLSAYAVGGDMLYVITECDRSVTTVLKANEY